MLWWLLVRDFLEYALKLSLSSAKAPGPARDRGRWPYRSLRSLAVPLPCAVQQTLPLGPCTVAAHGAPGHNRWGVAETPLPVKTQGRNAGCFFNLLPQVSCFSPREGKVPVNARASSARRETPQHSVRRNAGALLSCGETGSPPTRQEGTTVRHCEQGILRRATNHRTGGRPSQVTAGTNPSTGQVPQWNLKLRLRRRCARGQFDELPYSQSEISSTGRSTACRYNRWYCGPGFCGIPLRAPLLCSSPFLPPSVTVATDL